MKRVVLMAVAAAMVATLVPVLSQARKGHVIQPFPAVREFTNKDLKAINDQWAGKVYDFAPVRGGIHSLKQPDGTTFDAILTGAEIGGRFETLATGHTVTKNKSGWWTYAAKSKSKVGAIVATKKIVGVSSPAKIPAHLGRTNPAWMDTTGNDIRTQLFEYFRSKSVAATQAAQAAGEVRKMKIPALLLQTNGEFAEGSSPEATEDFLNGFGKDHGTTTEFYMEMSYGQLLFEVDVYGPYQSIPSAIDPCHYGGITVAGNANYESIDNQLTGGYVLGVGGGGVAGMAVEAVPQADRDVDFSQYDNDADGYVDLTFIVHSGPDMAVTGDPCDTWSHAISLQPTLESTGSPVPLGILTGDGVAVANFNTVPELGIPEGMDIGVVSHEATHNLGEPDFYDTSYKSQGTGDWDNMAGGSHFGDPPGSNPLHPNPLVKLAQAWVEPKMITKTTKNLRLRPWEFYPDVAMVPLRLGDDPVTDEVEKDAILEAHLIHFASRSAHGPRHWGSKIDGNDVPGIFDRMLLNSGLLVWHWDDTVGNNNDSSRFRLDLEEFDRLDKTQELALNHTRGEPTDPYFDTATGLSTATRILGSGAPSAPIPFSGTAVPTAQAPEQVQQPPLVYAFEFTVPNNPANLTMTVRETCATEGGDWDMYLDELQDGEWVQVASGATGACSEAAGLPQPTLGGQYRARVANWLAPDIAGGFTGEVSFGRGEVYFRPDTFNNEGAPTGWTIGNVRPGADGVQLSAELMASEFMSLDIIRDKAADVSPGFLRTAEALLTGRRGTLTTEVFNNGGTAAKNVVVTVTEGSTVIGRKTIASLAAGKAQEVTFDWTPATLGRHVLKLAVATASKESSTDNNDQATELEVFSARALGSVLIVDDDDGYDSQEAYAGALASLGIPYAVTQAHPSAAELKKYKAVVWEAGMSRMKGQLLPTDIAELKKYLDGGGRVWFSSPRMASGVGADSTTVTGQLNPGADPTFAANYLGIGYANSSSRGGGLAVPTADGLSKASYAFKPFPGRPIQDEPKIVGSAFGTVKTVLDWKLGDTTLAPIGTFVQGNAEHGNFRTVFTGFNVASVVTPEGQIDLVGSAMKALGISFGTARPNGAVLYHAPPVYSLRGETQIITAVVTGTDVRTVTLLYRAFGSKSYTAVKMYQRAANVYEAVLDGRLMQPPGIEYAIVADTTSGRLTAPAAPGFGYYMTIPLGKATPELPYTLSRVLGARYTPAGVAPASGASSGGSTGGGSQLPATGVGDAGLLGLIAIAGAIVTAASLRRRRLS